MVKVVVNSSGSNRISITNQNRDTVRTSGVDYTGTSAIATDALVKADQALVTANAAANNITAAYNSSNAAYAAANVALSTAQAAFNAANTAVTDYSPAFNQANIALSTAQSAFNAANNAVTDFSPAFNQANIAYSQANTAFAQANLAPTIANSYTTTVGTAGNTYARVVGDAGNTYARTVGTAGNTYTNTVGTAGNTYTNTVGTAGNNYTRTVGTAGNTYTALAYVQANTALATAQSAFAKANAGSVGSASDTQILYNDTSTVAGSSSLTFNKTTGTLGVANMTVTGTATLNAISIAIGSTELNNRVILASTTGISTLDSFNTTRGRSVYYNITANAGTDYHTTQISLLHNDTDAFITEYGTIWTNASLASFTAELVSGNILLNVSSSIANTTYNVFKIVNR